MRNESIEALYRHVQAAKEAVLAVGRIAQMMAGKNAKEGKLSERLMPGHPIRIN